MILFDEKKERYVNVNGYSTVLWRSCRCLSQPLQPPPHLNHAFIQLVDVVGVITVSVALINYDAALYALRGLI